jgi:circadian clock protein KaiC
MGITMLMTTELENSYIDLRFSPHETAFLTAAIILRRYVELKGRLTRVMAVKKVRASAHSKERRAFEIGDRGIVGGDRVEHYQGLLSGSPQLVPSARPAPHRPDKRRPRS